MPPGCGDTALRPTEGGKLRTRSDGLESADPIQVFSGSFNDESCGFSLCL